MAQTQRVLIAGESWTTHSIHQKGFDSFTTTEYMEGVGWLRSALESGGSVAKQGNILGSKTRYSGGAVSTYSLYNFDGNLDCSGNVYDYEGSVLTKNFSHVFREQVKDPTNQLSFVHGSCGWAK